MSNAPKKSLPERKERKTGRTTTGDPSHYEVTVTPAPVFPPPNRVRAAQMLRALALSPANLAQHYPADELQLLRAQLLSSHLRSIADCIDLPQRTPWPKGQTGTAQDLAELTIALRFVEQRAPSVLKKTALHQAAVWLAGERQLDVRNNAVIDGLTTLVLEHERWRKRHQQRIRAATGK